MSNAIYQTIALDNESIPYDAVFAVAASVATASVTSAIPPDSRLLSSGKELDTEIFLKWNTNNRADKDTIYKPLPPT